MKILVVGEGAWGTAIAYAIKPEHSMYLWCADAQIAHAIQTTGSNERYMPGVSLPTHIKATIDLAIAEQSDVIFFTTPMRFLAAVLVKFAPYITEQQLFMLCKGIDPERLELPTEMVYRILGKHADVLMGPSFAKGVIKGDLTGLVQGSASMHPMDLTGIFADHIRIEQSNDPIGIQICAAYKNVLAIGAGILDGLGIGANTKALFFTHAFNEMQYLVTTCGGQFETGLGLAGLGDLYLTATSTESRNFLIGQAIGSGKPALEVLNQYPYAEGPNTVKAIAGLQQRYDIQLHLAAMINEILFYNKSADIFLLQLHASI